MEERTGVVTLGGSPVTLVGSELKPGDRAPDFRAVDNDMKDVSLADFVGNTLVLSTVHSLDTGVCDVETRRFNTEAAALGDDVRVVTVSMDLPFAQKRWCAAAGVDRVTTVSDYREASFGKAYGVLIKENRLLARTVFVVDREGVVRYIQVVKDVTNEPDYAAVLAAVRGLTGREA